ncbi:MAG: hypothetical protein M3P18_21560 [Actinomycetota bacterium]|nr:hypothetical protein [Actinomycetota bacterium]
MRGRLGIRVLMGLLAAALLTPVLTSPAAGANATSTCAATKLSRVSYTAIDGHAETLIPWEGTNVAVLVEPGITRDPSVMSRMVCAFDRAWAYYKKTTGETPVPIKTINGRTDVAEVSSTCGAGCTYLGGAGTEIQTTYFENGYDEIANHNLYDQVPFYEFGRSFWFWSDQLQYSDPCTHPDPAATGFAVWMRFRSMIAAGVGGAPFNGTPFDTFRSRVRGLEGVYDNDTSDTFAGTLCANTSPGAYGGTDFWASIMMKLASLYGGQMFVRRFFSRLSSLPAATDTPSAITNWLHASHYASCVDLKSVFYKRWGFPQPDGSVVDPRPAASTVPFPTGHC